jgi:hypothetical protein
MEPETPSVTNEHEVQVHPIGCSLCQQADIVQSRNAVLSYSDPEFSIQRFALRTVEDGVSIRVHPPKQIKSWVREHIRRDDDAVDRRLHVMLLSP